MQAGVVEAYMQNRAFSTRAWNLQSRFELPHHFGRGGVEGDNRRALEAYSLTSWTDDSGHTTVNNTTSTFPYARS